MQRAPKPLEPADVDRQASDGTLDELYRRHASWLKAGLKRRFGRAVLASADDLVQEAYLRAAQVRREGPIRSPRALLMRIASRLAFDQLRAARRAEAPACGASAALDSGIEADQDAALLLKQIILSLPADLRDVFIMSRFGGLTYEEIADRVGVSSKVIEYRMSKALALCAAQLRR